MLNHFTKLHGFLLQYKVFIAAVLCHFYDLFTLKGLTGMLCIKDLDIRNISPAF